MRGGSIFVFDIGFSYQTVDLIREIPRDMLTWYIKYFILFICTLYAYGKLLNFKTTGKRVLSALIFSAALPMLIHVVGIYFSALIMPVLFICVFFYIAVGMKNPIGLSITTLTIALGISFASFLFASCLTSFALIAICKFHQIQNDTIAFFIEASLQVSSINMLFRIRRLKSGMPFLLVKGNGNIGVLLSTILLCCFFIASNSHSSGSLAFTAFSALVFLGGVILYLWWRARLKKLYLEHLRDAEVQRLRHLVQEDEEKIRTLEKDNESLAKIIHKDNKLIPAMELAVKKLLYSAEYEKNDRLVIVGRQLLEQLEAISHEREGIITDYQSQDHKLPMTNIPQIDSLMSYMFAKAKKEDVRYELVLFGEVGPMTKQVISLTDLSTLLADLCENAIMAAKDGGIKKVLVTLGVYEGIYSLSVFDSGAFFEPKVLRRLGQAGNTTHADTGGSGIGLMTAVEIVNRYHASLTIQEFSSENRFFTKKISVQFDYRNQCVIKTRSNEKTVRFQKCKGGADKNLDQ